MDSLAILIFVTQAAHLIGYVGCVVCLLFFYVQIVCLFVPSVGFWNGFRLTRLLGLIQRFLWIIWLTGISMIISQHNAEPESFQSPLIASKVLILLVLSISTIGLDSLVRRLFYSVEGARKLFVTHREAHFIKFSLAASVASWGAVLFLAFCYFIGAYSHGMLILVGVLLFSLTLAFLLQMNNRWINNMTGPEAIKALQK